MVTLSPRNCNAGELAAYTAVLLVAALSCVLNGFKISKEFDRHGSLAGKLPGLWRGWLFGRSVDLSDIQWRSFRGSLPLLLVVAAITSAISRLVVLYKPTQRTTLYIILGGIYVGYCHGCWALMLLMLITVNYIIAKTVSRSKYGPAVVWMYNCAALMIVKACGDVKWRNISPWLSVLDAYSGSLRWDVVFNLTVLRCISFGCDYCWATNAESSPVPMKVGKGSLGRNSSSQDQLTLEIKLRATRPLAPSEYCWMNYLSYLLYPPLYFSGPIISFNAFVSQLNMPLKLKTQGVVWYAVRWLACVLLLELITHCCYFAAISRFRDVLRQQRLLTWGPLQACLVTFWVLMFMWLKFLVIWRFARLWALMDGIATVDNIGRCVCNNYDAEGFWQNWHCSFNQWLVRYMYIPLGGSSKRLFNMWPIFTFVALWHDLHPRLLGWAWITCAAFAPELGLKWAMRQLFSDVLRQQPLFNYGAAVAAAINIAALITANMVGFVVGVDGMRVVVAQVYNQPGVLLILFTIFFSAAQLMFALRRREAATGTRTLAVQLI